MDGIEDNISKIEIAKLREKLNSNYPSDRKVAAREAISMMRAGENMQSLFSDMLRCAKTDDLELKKLIYLYLVNYSTQEPEQAIMAVNIFIQDSNDPNSLIRALAVRTMCRIKLESVAENMIVPLKMRLNDDNPYVKKTAAIGVAKLYEIIPEAVESAQLIDQLVKLLNDDNPMVVSNTTAAIFEINELRSTPIFKLSSQTISPILAAISSCSDWCQAIFLDAISRYIPESADEASFLIDRLIPMLKNSNPSVVVGSFKCIFLFMEICGRNPSEVFPQVIPPFITLVSSSEAEIQYVVLRTLSLFVQKYPRALSKEIRVFFCKYNDPSYVKLEKLDIIVTICNEMTAQIVLDEFYEYCNAIDVEFVRKAVRCIGQIAVKIQAATPRCVDILVSLIDGKAEYAIEESIIVVSDILRRFPGSFESVIAAVCKNFDQIKDSRAKSAAVWMLGEYCSIIEGVDQLLDPFLDTFHDEPPSVQLQILTALVKVYLEKPNDAQDLLQYVIAEATKGSVVPDVRNRAFVYWRLLSLNTETSQLVVKFSKQAVTHSGVQFDDSILSELIRNMGSVSGVLHIVPSDFVHRVVVTDDYDDDLLVARNWKQLPFESNLCTLCVDWESVSIHFKITNISNIPINNIAIAINKNPLGIGFANVPAFPQEIGPSESYETEVPLVFKDQLQGLYTNPNLAIALRLNGQTLYTTTFIPPFILSQPNGKIEPEDFQKQYVLLDKEIDCQIPGSLADDTTLRNRNIFVIARKDNKTFVSFLLPPNNLFIAQIDSDGTNLSVHFKTNDEQMLQYIVLVASSLLSPK